MEPVQSLHLSLANGESVTASHKGKRLVKGAGYIENVYYCSELSQNILSVSQMVKAGLEVTFKNEKCAVLKGTNQILSASLNPDGVYHLNHEMSCVYATVCTAAKENAFHQGSITNLF